MKKRIIEFLKANKIELLFLFLIIVLAAFFRFWRLEDTQFLTYDQARDFIIIKRMIVDHKFTLVGTTVLIPGVYLPPFYYYSLAPFLFLFKLHVVGADVYTALLGTGAVFVFYLLVKNIFNKTTALLSSLVFAVLPLLVVTSRHAWNPNPTHFFSLLLIFFVWMFLKRKHWSWLYGAFAIFGLGLNFHLTIITFAPLLAGVFLWRVKKQRNFFQN